MKLAFADPVAKTLDTLTCRALADRIKRDIDTHCVQKLTGDHRSHLGASVIGHDCARHIWYAFRWAKFEMFEGRMLRLFERGQLEEQRFVAWLRSIGFTVWEVDPETGKQFRIWGASGHYGGSTDAVGILPYPELQGLPLLLEFKTHNRGSFKHLIENKLQIAKPRHYAQMCSYGAFYKFNYGLYCAINKDDDDLYFEVVPLDWSAADDLMKKAEDIITAEVPPAKVSLQPSYFECRYCPFVGVCHHNEPMEKNCRSCRYAKPAEAGQWYCTQFGGNIPADFIAKGCDRHTAIG